jgi:hypothetical protein
MQNIMPWMPPSPAQCCMGDPLCEFLIKQRKPHRLPIYLIIGMAVGALQFISGYIISQVYAQAGRQFLGMLDHPELLTSLVVYLIYTPIIWGCYGWQPHAISDLLTKLHTGQFLEPTGPAISQVASKVQSRSYDKNNPLEQVAEFFFKPSGRRTVVASLLLMLLLVAGYVSNTTTWQGCSRDLHCFGRSQHWLDQSEIYFFLVYCPLIAFNVIFSYIMGIRQILLVGAISRLLRFSRIKPKLLHPDNCCGLSFVGTYVIKTGWFVFLVGITLLLQAVNPLLANQPLALAWHQWVTTFAFLLLVPLFAITPSWLVHKALQEAKEIDLEPYSREVVSLLDTPSPPITRPLDSIILERIQLVQSLDNAYQTTPFPGSRGITFLVTYLIPIGLAIASLIIQIVQAK